MSIEILGVTISEPYPIGFQHVALRPGLNVLYGRNGAGKSLILDSVANLLQGTNPDFSSSTVDQNQLGFYSSSGIHVRIKPEGKPSGQSRRLWEAGQSEVDIRLGGWIENFLSSEPWNSKKSESELTQPLIFPHLSEEQWRWIFDQGHWLIKPKSEKIFICDPNPWNSPLRGIWENSQSWWSRRLQEYSSHWTLLRDAHARHSETEPEEGQHLEKARQIAAAMIQHLSPATRWSEGVDDISSPSTFVEWLATTEVFAKEPSPPFVLTPLPEIFGFHSPPPWVAFPVALLDLRLRWVPATSSIRQTQSPEFVHQAADSISERLIKRLANIELATFVDSDSFDDESVSAEMTSNSEREKERVEFWINSHLEQLFDEPPRVQIETSTGIPGFRFSQKPPLKIMVALHGARRSFPFEQLGDAHRRFVFGLLELALNEHLSRVDELLSDSLADALSMLEFPHQSVDEPIERAIGALTVESPTVLVIDEPERGLHARAEQRLASSLVSMADHVLTATHSLRFLRESLIDGRAHLVERETDGTFRINSGFLGLSAKATRALEDVLGVGPEEVATLTSAFVFVEGLHDQIIIENLLAPEFERFRVKVLNMSGTKGLPDLVTSPFVFAATSAPVIICMDNGIQSDLERVLGEIRSKASVVERSTALSRNRGLFRSPEMKALHSVLFEAIASDRFDRIHPFFFKKADILEYLPIERLSDGKFVSWKQARDKFLESENRTKFVRGDGERYKTWMRGNGIQCNAKAISRVSRELTPGAVDESWKRPIEFDDLAALILRVVSP